MRIKEQVRRTIRYAALLMILMVVNAGYALAQAALLSTNPLTISEVRAASDDITVVTKLLGGRIPGNGIEVLMHHATTCDKVMFQEADKPSGPNFSGCIRGAYKPSGIIKVQLLGLSSQRRVTDERGEFLFQDVPAGEYFLQVSQGSRILALNRISVSPRTVPIIINVTPRADGFVNRISLSEY